MREKFSDMSEAKKGDRVFVFRGPEPREDRTNAVITGRYEQWEHPLEVIDDNGIYSYYTPDGKVSENDALPSLFWSIPEIIIPKMPRITVEKTVKVTPFITDLDDNEQRVTVFPLSEGWLQNGPEQEVVIEVWEEIKS